MGERACSFACACAHVHAVCLSSVFEPLSGWVNMWRGYAFWLCNVIFAFVYIAQPFDFIGGKGKEVEIEGEREKQRRGVGITFLSLSFF